MCIRDSIQAVFCSGIDSEWLIVNAACIYKVCTLLLIKLIQIWNMLEVVCIKLSTLNYLVWSYIVIKYSNFKFCLLYTSRCV